MRQVLASATGRLALAVMLLGSVAAQAQTAAPDNTLPYRHAYKNTQLIFDQCGDVARGDLFRKVVREKVDHCPVFSEADKAGFRTWAAARSAEYSVQSTQASAQGPVPATPDMIRGCKEFTFTTEYYRIRRLIDRYGRGESSADDVIQEACQPAQP
jgi:hypothetical protein